MELIADKKSKEKKLTNQIILLLLFGTLSLFYIFLLYRRGLIFFGDDMEYHINRILELVQHFKSGDFRPYTYPVYYNKVEFPLGIFYPQFTLYPFAIFCIILKSNVTGIYAGFAFYTFLTLYITYYVSKKMNSSRGQAIITAVLYAFCGYRFIDAFSRFALGEYLAMTFLPLVFYGFFAIMYGNKKDWHVLSIGLSLILLSHVLTTFIVIVVLVPIFIVSIFFINEKVSRIKYLLLSAIITIGCTSIFLFPFLEQVLFHTSGQPTPISLYTVSYNFGDLLVNSFNNNMDSQSVYNIGFLLVVAAIIGLIKFNRLDLKTKLIWLIATITFMLSSNLFPLNLLQRTPIQVIQFTWRFLVISSVLYSFVGGEIVKIIYIDIQEKNKFINERSIGIACILLILFIYAGGQTTYLRNAIQYESYNGNNKGFSGEAAWHIADYIPRNTMKSYDEIMGHIAIIDGSKIKIDEKFIKCNANTQVFSFDKLYNSKSVELPIVYYKNLKVYQNNRELHITKGNNGRITINQTGKGEISVKFVPSYIDNVSIFISLLSFIMLIVYGFQNSKKNKITSLYHNNIEGK